MGELKISQVDVEAVEKAAAAWSARASPKTANKMLTTLAAVFDLAKRWKLIRDNPANEAERLKIAVDDEDGEIVTQSGLHESRIEKADRSNRDREH